MNKIILAALCISLQTFTAGSVWASDSDLSFKPVHITDGIYSIISPSYGRPTVENQGWNSNSYFVVTDTGVLVFDTGSSEKIGKAIIGAVQTITDKPIRWVINSHSHADHWLGNAAFADLGAEILSSPQAIDTMKNDGPLDVKAFAQMTEGATGTPRLSLPGIIINHGEKRLFGDLEAAFIFSNDGHSPGDILVYLPGPNVVLGGDVVSSDYLPIMTHHGNLTALIESLQALTALNPAIILPGHGQPTTTRSVIRDSELLRDVVKLVMNGKANSKSPEEVTRDVVTALGPKYRSEYADFDANSQYLVTMIYRSTVSDPDGGSGR
ncbi:hypothetical protein GCM10017044_05070 [Kordiimonas sediminis]|uniref:Metallo-beta-lactamase domain-containing protein n=1 Tax=Kordiimonas sediminis TaxID=1735581 RepID=A0A919E2W8_9PROT|nr:MBL fold metallo-hydrolase [Kordiimonas sediminis]GHF13967.1 hypothetical protein GCM10017044_05070 [Kordiimonas sediminis]